MGSDVQNESLKERFISKYNFGKFSKELNYFGTQTRLEQAAATGF